MLFDERISCGVGTCASFFVAVADGSRFQAKASQSYRDSQCAGDDYVDSFSTSSLEDLPDLLKVLVAVQLVALRAEVLHGTAKGLWGRKKRVWGVTCGLNYSRKPNHQHLLLWSDCYACTKSNRKPHKPEAPNPRTKHQRPENQAVFRHSRRRTFGLDWLGVPIRTLIAADIDATRTPIQRNSIVRSVQ